MSRVIILDSGPLGMVTNPKESEPSGLCKTWLKGLLDSGAQVIIPEIADYEVRRELTRGQRTKAIARLDALGEQLEYLPISTVAMRHAAELWAMIRNAGQPTASPDALDGDAILAGQALAAGFAGDEVIIATTNVGHLGRFSGIDAMPWNQIEA